MADQVAGTSDESDYPGERLALPRTGPGSLAGWGKRITALVVDWLICTVVSVVLFSPLVLTANGWYRWATLLTFFVESAVLCAFAGGSAGQLICRLAVVRVDRTPLGFGRSVLRAALVCVVLPAVVIGTDRRGLHDLAAGTVVVTRR